MDSSTSMPIPWSAQAGKIFTLDVASQQVIHVLAADESRVLKAVCDTIRFSDLPRIVVAAADVSDFSTANQFVERSHRLFHGRKRIGSMDLIEVDVVGIQSPQTGVNRFADMLSRQALCVRRVCRAEPALGGQDQILASMAADRLPQHFFGDAGAVHVGGVDEVAACLDECIA